MSHPRPCPNYFVRFNPDNLDGLDWDVVRDNQDGTKARPVARLATQAEAVARCDAIKARTQTRGKFRAQRTASE